MKLPRWIAVLCLAALAGAAGCMQPQLTGDPAIVEPSQPPATKTETQPAKQLPRAPDLMISYGNESQDGMLHFEHTNERLHYLRCLDRIEETLQQTSGPVNLTIRMGKQDLSWELDFHRRLSELAENERLKINSIQARSSKSESARR